MALEQAAEAEIRPAQRHEEGQGALGGIAVLEALRLRAHRRGETAVSAQHVQLRRKVGFQPVRPLGGQRGDLRDRARGAIEDFAGQLFHVVNP